MRNDEVDNTELGSTLMIAEEPGSVAISRPLTPVRPSFLRQRPIKFDMSSGSVRYFGPTSYKSIVTRFGAENSKNRQSFWPIAALVPGLSPDLHGYLMESYWTCHNSVIHLVHRHAFNEGLKRSTSQFYSNTLHVCMLAEGLRFADVTRTDVKKLKPLGHPRSSLHATAKKLVEADMAKPGGIPFIQALFLLADLETTRGYDDLGWMFSGKDFWL